MGQTETFDLLLDIIGQISSARDSTATLQAVIKGAIELTHTALGAIRYINQTSSGFEVIDTFQYPQQMNIAKPRVSSGKGITYYVITTGEIFASADVTNDPHVNPELKSLGFSSVIVVPLSIKKEIIGALYLYDYKRRAFTDSDRYVLSKLAGHAAISLRKAQDTAKLIALHEASRKASTTLLMRLKDRSSDILQVMADEILTIAQATWVSVTLIDEKGQGYHTTISGHSETNLDIRPDGHSLFVIRTKESFYVRDVMRYSGTIPIHPRTLRQKLVSILCLPLLIDGNPIGVTWLHYSKEDARDLNEHDISSLQDYVNHASYIYSSAIAIQRDAEKTERLKSRLISVATLVEHLSLHELSTSNTPVENFWSKLSNMFPDLCSALDVAAGRILWRPNSQRGAKIVGLDYQTDDLPMDFELNWKSMDKSQTIEIVDSRKFCEWIIETSDTNRLVDLLDETQQVALLTFHSNTPGSDTQMVIIFVGRRCRNDAQFLSFDDQKHLLHTVAVNITDFYHAALRLEEKTLFDRGRDDLYYHLAHEIGTPMIGLISTAHAMVLELKDQSNTKAHIATHLLEQANKLYLLSETMLAAMGTPPKPNSRNFTIHNLVRPILDACAMFEAEARFKHCDIQRPQGPFPDTYMSLHDLTIAFKNLISNAVKYSYYPASNTHLNKRYIRITGYWLNGENTHFAVEIQNYGVGITEDEIKSRSIFQRFTRGSHSGDRLRTGKGLGLAQVEHAVRVIHNGEVNVESVKVSGGAYLTTFTVVLPII